MTTVREALRIIDRHFRIGRRGLYVFEWMCIYGLKESLMLVDDDLKAKGSSQGVVRREDINTSIPRQRLKDRPTMEMGQ